MLAVKERVQILHRIHPLQVIFTATWALSLVAFYGFFRPVYNSGLLFLSRRWMLALGLAGAAVLIETVLMIASFTPLREKLDGLHAAILLRLKRLRWANWVFLALTTAIFSFLLVGRFGDKFFDMPIRLYLFWLTVLIGWFFLRAAGLPVNGWEALGASAILIAGIYRAAALLPDLSTSPFSLDWSEASRYYYASLFFSKRLYGIAIPPSVLHPTRYLLQSVPFLIPDSPLWLHRLWQVLLWVLTTFAASYLLARRLLNWRDWRFWGLAAWAFCYLLIGPVYYHLLVAALLVLWGYDRRHPWRTTLVVLVASIWAGVSRINWFPVPGMLAATLYFLEEPLGGRPILGYLLRPLGWTAAGTLLAFGAQALYVALSGNPSSEFASTFTSDLLWYRLLPNPTYPAGILLSMVFVSLPLWLALAIQLRGRLHAACHPWRLAGLASILAVLLVGGVVVSTKIGGGSNLHNLDAYMTLLMVVTAHFLFGKAQPEPEEVNGAATLGIQPLPIHWLVMASLLAMPIYYTLTYGSPVDMPTAEQTQKALGVLDQVTERVVDSGGQVLFIGERQLIMFHYLKTAVPMVPDYERVFLMEMAMSDNPDYLNRFHQQLKDHQFAMIVVEPLNIVYKGSASSFGEENDAWVNQVSKPVLCYYEVDKTLRDVRLQVLVPRDKPNPNCS
jgi:hypothetical protein